MIAFLGEEIVANIGGEIGVVGGDGDVAARGELAPGVAADAEQKDDEHGNEDSGDTEGAATNLLEVLALGDEQHVTRRIPFHRGLPPTVWIKISSSEGSTSSK